MGLNNFYCIIQFGVLFLLLSLLQFFRMKKDNRVFCRIQILALLLYSCCYIGFVDIRFVACITLVGMIAFIGGQIIDCRRTRAITSICIVMLLGILGYFKYTNFFINSVNEIFGTGLDKTKIILPLGISFYIFSAISYVIDVYRGTCSAEKNILDFGLYIFFFPKIIAGPIIRWTDFKPQIKAYRGINVIALSEGIQIFIFGLFKKNVLADHLGVFVDDVFKAPMAFTTGTVILSAISYSLQIYLDFSGYSDMAIGLAKIFGFDFKLNFNLPYFARSFSDFWERWHISLSSWFRDYLYIPLGGSRRGKKRTINNLFVVMIISGLWHGAGWTFIIWGGLHGLASCVGKVTSSKIRDNKNEAKVINNLSSVILTFILVTLFWIVFRAENLNNLMIYLKSLFSIHGGISQPYSWSFVAIVCVLITTLVAVLKAKKNDKKYVSGFYPILDLNGFWQLVVFFVFTGLTVMLGYYGNTAFIYGRF